MATYNEVLQQVQSWKIDDQLQLLQDMQKIVNFGLPVDRDAINIHQEAQLKAKESYLMTLLKYGVISSGRAAKLMGISRLDLIELMSDYGLSIFQPETIEELELEVMQTLEVLARCKN